MEPQQWRPVVGWEGFYQVSSLGQVQRTKRGPRTRPGLVLKPSLNSTYPHVSLHRDGKRAVRSVHALVAQAFLGLRPPGQEVNHKNGIKTDYRLVNLEWTTPAGNVQHAIATGLLIPGPRNPPRMHGETNPAAKLTAADVREIRHMQSLVSQTELARRFQVSRQAIAKVHRRKAWGHIR
jgi:hypothetical protein